MPRLFGGHGTRQAGRDRPEQQVASAPRVSVMPARMGSRRRAAGRASAKDGSRRFVIAYLGSLDSTESRRLFEGDSAAVFVGPDLILVRREYA